MFDMIDDIPGLDVYKWPLYARRAYVLTFPISVTLRITVGMFALFWMAVFAFGVAIYESNWEILWKRHEDE